MYLDPARQAQYEMILGINRDKYFPSLYSHINIGSSLLVPNSNNNNNPNSNSSNNNNSASSSATISSKSADFDNNNTSSGKELSQSIVECVSRYPSTILKPLPCILSHAQSAGLTDVLLQDQDGFCWICPSGYDITEVR